MLALSIDESTARASLAAIGEAALIAAERLADASMEASA
jgi:hypothetical protein